MPMHDWDRIEAGTYHNFHFLWLASIIQKSNAGLLPPEFSAMAEQVIGVGNGDVDNERFARRPNIRVVRHRLGEVVAVMELGSRANKNREHSVKSFVAKSVELLPQGVNLLIVDPFPPNERNPEGLHPLIWAEFSDDNTFNLPQEQPLLIAAYQAEPIKTAHIEPLAVGDVLPEMPLSLYFNLLSTFLGVPQFESCRPDSSGSLSAMDSEPSSFASLIPRFVEQPYQLYNSPEWLAARWRILYNNSRLSVKHRSSLWVCGHKSALWLSKAPVTPPQPLLGGLLEPRPSIRSSASSKRDSPTTLNV